MSRSLAREDAFKLVFEMRVTGAQPEAVIAYMCETADAENEMWAQEKVTRDSLHYIQDIVTGIEENKEKINGIIEPKLKKWTIDRLSKVDISVLQLAVYEIWYMDSIPLKVTANEAVQLAKKYGGSESGSFINGVIGSVIKEKEAIKELK